MRPLCSHQPPHRPPIPHSFSVINNFLRASLTELNSFSFHAENVSGKLFPGFDYAAFSVVSREVLLAGYCAVRFIFDFFRRKPKVQTSERSYRNYHCCCCIEHGTMIFNFPEREMEQLIGSISAVCRCRYSVSHKPRFRVLGCYEFPFL